MVLMAGCTHIHKCPFPLSVSKRLASPCVLFRFINLPPRDLIIWGRGTLIFPKQLLTSQNYPIGAQSSHRTMVSPPASPPGSSPNQSPRAQNWLSILALPQAWPPSSSPHQQLLAPSLHSCPPVYASAFDFSQKNFIQTETSLFQALASNP